MVGDIAALGKAAESPAGSTILKIIGAALPDALVEPFRERMVARDTRNKIDAAVGDALARQMADNPDVVARAQSRLLSQAFVKQKNIEAVTMLAVEHGALDNGDDIQPEDDWINIFNGYAEKASSDKMRDLFGRILAGQIRKSNSFSPATMRMVAELDIETATDLQKMADLALGDRIYTGKDFEGGENLVFLERLATYGCVHSQDLASSPHLKSGEYIHVVSGAKALEFKALSDVKMRMPFRQITKAGIQLLSIISPKPVDEIIYDVAQRVKQDEISASICDFDNGKVYRCVKIY